MSCVIFNKIICNVSCNTFYMTHLKILYLINFIKKIKWSWITFLNSKYQSKRIRHIFCNEFVCTSILLFSNVRFRSSTDISCNALKKNKKNISSLRRIKLFVNKFSSLFLSASNFIRVEKALMNEYHRLIYPFLFDHSDSNPLRVVCMASKFDAACINNLSLVARYLSIPTSSSFIIFCMSDITTFTLTSTSFNCVFNTASTSSASFIWLIESFRCF
ncbi:hypothetical protein AGLY_014563 [Aphis glycines]|uniref:Uncharacterized protein n=1 Tax=Aphis glycines TaxID=307491 RepID=A0A6G0T3J9_APHGL|nr:hypothetical protein AGLY_014563 [Aphis glycines]